MVNDDWKQERRRKSTPFYITHYLEKGLMPSENIKTAILYKKIQVQPGFTNTAHSDAMPLLYHHQGPLTNPTARLNLEFQITELEHR